MNRKLPGTLGVCALLFGASSLGIANAADLAYRAPPRAVGGCASANWNGFYVGINAGDAMHRSTLSDQGNAFAEQFGSSVGTQTDTTNGGFVGGTVGYNFQRCLTFVGIEADWDWSRFGTSYAVNPTITGSNWLISDNMKQFGTVRGRTGVALESLLLYVTAGAAWANINHAVAANPVVFGGPAFTPIGFNDTTTQWGWAAGAGAEWSFTPNLSLKSEVLVLGFKDQTHVINFLPRFGPHVFPLNNFTSSDEIFVFKTGLNWRFGGGPGVFGPW